MRVLISASRETQIALTSWLTTVGMCTDGSSIRHDASLNTRASRTSFFSPRWPTPSDRTSVAATTRTSWPARWAAPRDTKRLGAGLDDHPRRGALAQERAQPLRPAAPFQQISPAALRTQIWLSLLPRSMPMCSMVGSSRGPVSAPVEAGHFILF